MKIRLSKCSISQLEIDAVSRVLQSEYLGMGESVQSFEAAIKKYMNTNLEVVCVNTGTSALHLSLAAIDIKAGDEVLVPSLTYIASFQAISATGATPIACEVDSSTLFIDVNDAKSKITDKTKAIMPVHYASSSTGMVDVYSLARKYNLRVIEDAAQSFGCSREGEMIGVTGDIICFSFDGIKNITSGEGGAVITSDKLLAQKLKDGRLLGVEKDTDKRYSGSRSWEFDVSEQGYRYHMSNINAAIGIVQLERIESFKKKRQSIVANYIHELDSVSEITYLEFKYEEIMAHIFVIKAKRRNDLRLYLIEQGIECGVHYKPNHLLKKYKSKGSLPVTESVYGEILTLPCHVDLSENEQAFIINKIKEFYNA